jgi:hypothetical protein
MASRSRTRPRRWVWVSLRLDGLPFLGRPSIRDRTSTGISSSFVLPCHSSSSEFLHFTPAPRLTLGAPPARFSSLIATSPQRVHSSLARLPKSHFVPPSGFLSLSTAYSALRLTSLFHLVATSRVRCSGSSPVRAATFPSREEPAPLPLSCRPLANELIGRPRTDSRLRGLDPRGGAFPRNHPRVAPLSSFHPDL